MDGALRLWCPSGVPALYTIRFRRTEWTIKWSHNLGAWNHMAHLFFKTCVKLHWFLYTRGKSLRHRNHGYLPTRRGHSDSVLQSYRTTSRRDVNQWKASCSVSVRFGADRRRQKYFSKRSTFACTVPLFCSAQRLNLSAEFSSLFCVCVCDANSLSACRAPIKRTQTHSHKGKLEPSPVPVSRERPSLRSMPEWIDMRWRECLVWEFST